MSIDWLSIGVQTGLIAAILAGFLVTIRYRMTKWVSLGFARMMKTLSNDAAKEGGTGNSSSASPTGALSLGGIPIGGIIQALSDPNVQKLIGQFLNRGGGSSGGGW